MQKLRLYVKIMFKSCKDNDEESVGITYKVGKLTKNLIKGLYDLLFPN